MGHCALTERGKEMLTNEQLQELVQDAQASVDAAQQRYEAAAAATLRGEGDSRLALDDLTNAKVSLVQAKAHLLLRKAGKR